MRYNYSKQFDDNYGEGESLKRMLHKLLRRQSKLEVLVTQRPQDSGRVPATMSKAAGVCGTAQTCSDQVSGQTKLFYTAANRTSTYSIDPSGLAAGATSAAASFVVKTGSVDFLANNGLWRTIYVTDIVGGPSAAPALDSFQVNVNVSNVPRIDFNGGRFSRGNSNTCTTACGIVVCAGSIELVTITVTNITAAAIAAGTTPLRIETRVAWLGEEGFVCFDDGSCRPAEEAAVPTIAINDCDCHGGE